MSSRRRPYSPEEERRLATFMHLAIIDGLSRSRRCRAEQIAFHGGTALHLAWGSPRYSEDLDFLVSDEAEPNLGEVVNDAIHTVREHIVLLRPEASIELRDKRKPGREVAQFWIVLSDPKKVGNVKVKLEFLPVNQELINRYESRLSGLRLPPNSGLSGWIAHIAPSLLTAPQAQILADKLKACATRPAVKWRDVFDIWWLRTQADIPSTGGDPERSSERFEILAGIYANQREDYIRGLREFVRTPSGQLLDRAVQELRPWLPGKLWQLMWPVTVAEMVQVAKDEARAAVTVLEAATWGNNTRPVPAGGAGPAPSPKMGG